jgi:hypothetical protein
MFRETEEINVPKGFIPKRMAEFSSLLRKRLAHARFMDEFEKSKDLPDGNRNVLTFLEEDSNISVLRERVLKNGIAKSTIVVGLSDNMEYKKIIERVRGVDCGELLFYSVERDLILVFREINLESEESTIVEDLNKQLFEMMKAASEKDKGIVVFNDEISATLNETSIEVINELKIDGNEKTETMERFRELYNFKRMNEARRRCKKSKPVISRSVRSTLSTKRGKQLILMILMYLVSVGDAWGNIPCLNSEIFLEGDSLEFCKSECEKSSNNVKFPNLEFKCHGYNHTIKDGVGYCVYQPLFVCQANRNEGEVQMVKRLVKEEGIGRKYKGEYSIEEWDKETNFTYKRPYCYASRSISLHSGP